MIAETNSIIFHKQHYKTGLGNADPVHTQRGRDLILVHIIQCSSYPFFIKFSAVNIEDSNKNFYKGTALLWVIAQRVVIISYGRFGTIYRSHRKGSRILNMEPTGSSETSVRNYHYSLRNSPQERSSHLLRGGSLKSRKTFYKSRLILRRKTLRFTTCHTS
jgi:hypothetical protein